VRSTNLTEWESHATGNPVSFTAIGYNGEVFVAAGRRLLRSVDGVNWTRVSSGAFQRVIWTGQYWIGVESFGQLSYSADGVDGFEPGFGVGYEVADVIHADGRVWALIDDNRDGYRVVSFAEDFTDRKVVELSGFGLSPPRGNFVVGARQLNIWTESRRFASFDGDNWEAQPYDGRSWYRVVRWGSRHAGLDTSGNFYLSSPAPSLSTLTVVDLAAPVASGEAVQLEVSGTTAGAMLQWFEGAVGDTSRPVVGATARVAEVVPVETTQYWARQSNGVSFIDSPAIAVEVFTVAPTIRETPVGGVGQVGDSFVMTVSAEGSPVLAYQWFKDNQAIGGETLASLSMSELILADAGRYHVVVSNAAGSVASAPVRLSVLPIGAQVVGTHEVVSTTVLPGQAVRIRNTIAFDEAVSSITWSVLLPAEWEYLNASGVTGNPSLVPQPGDHDLLEWNWDSLSGDSMQWEYELRFPASEPRGGALVGLVAVERASVQLEVLVSPDPLVVSATRHSADTDGDQRLSLSELLRVIELYNTRAGSSRTGRYRLAAGSADGFDPDSRGIGEGDTPSRFHSADMDRDGRLSLSELLRVIELYKTRSGSSRTGAYRINPDSADGFDPDN
jgi:hypothetical protein